MRHDAPWKQTLRTSVRHLLDVPEEQSLRSYAGERGRRAVRSLERLLQGLGIAPPPSGGGDTTAEPRAPWPEPRKFDLGPGVERGPVREQIPWGYGEDRITAMPVDPDRLYTYWEVTDGAIEAARRGLGAAGETAWLCLRVYDVTGRIFDGTNAHAYFDHRVERHDRQWFFSLGRPGCSACVEVGMKSIEGYFVRIARSARVDLPRADVAPDAPAEWMTVRQHAAGFAEAYEGVARPAEGRAPADGRTAPDASHGSRTAVGAPHGSRTAVGAPHGSRTAVGAPHGSRTAVGAPHGSRTAVGAPHGSRTAVGASRDGAASGADATDEALCDDGAGAASGATGDGGFVAAREGQHEISRRVEWVGGVERASWQAGPFPHAVRPPAYELTEERAGAARTVETAQGRIVVEQPWSVTIRGIGATLARRVIGRWEILRTVPAPAAPARIEGVPDTEQVHLGGPRSLVRRGASEERLAAASELRLAGASEEFLLGASELRFGGASESLTPGASERRWAGASERMWLGASELRQAGASERIVRGASEERLVAAAPGWQAGGASEHLLGASERRLGGASESRLGGQASPERSARASWQAFAAAGSRLTPPPAERIPPGGSATGAVASTGTSATNDPPEVCSTRGTTDAARE
ncbi:MAG: DUF4912 domain-containing protein [Deltaproteobacteria bacterium]|nr:DUF4912 domain-containing protein [Deltaproteobacteria bacterium]